MTVVLMWDLFLSFLSQDFHYPLFMTLVHITIIFSLSAITRRILHSWTGKPRVLLNWTDYLHRVAPTGTSTAFTCSLRRKQEIITGQIELQFPRLSRVFHLIEMSLEKKEIWEVFPLVTLSLITILSSTSCG